MPLQVDIQGTQAQLRVDQHRGLEVHFIEVLAEIRQDDDGELQPLGLVDGHDAHTSGGTSGCGGGLLPVLQEKAQVADKGEKALVARALIGAGIAAQGDQVFPALLPSRHGPEDPQDIQLVIQQPQQPVDAHILGTGAQVRQLLQKRQAVPVPAFRHRLVKVAPCVTAPEDGQLIGGKAEQRGAKHGDEGYVLPGVVQNLEQGADHRHLHGGEKVLPLLGGVGDVPLRKGPGIMGKPGPRGAHEHHNILRAAGPHRLCILIHHREAAVQQGADPLRHKSGLRQVAGDRAVLLIPACGHIQQVELHGAVLPLRQIVRAEVQRLAGAVVQLPHLL